MSLNDYQQVMMAELDYLNEVWLLALDHLVAKKKNMEWMCNKMV